MKSLLRYAGGQRQLAKKIMSSEKKIYIPNFSEYREPFLGGGSVYFAIKDIYPNVKYWINDLDSDLINFWKMCKDQNEMLIDQISKWKKECIGSEEDFKKDFKENGSIKGRQLHQFLHQNMYRFNNIEKASAYYILDRISFSGMPMTGGFSESAYSTGLKDSVILGIADAKKILQGTKITNLDYQQVVEEEGDNVFIFCGPPYYNVADSRLYGRRGNLHRYFDFYRFAEVMKCIRDKHKWLITLDDSNTVRRLFGWAKNIEEYEVHYVMRKVDKVGRELLISNYEFKQIYQDIEEAWGINED